jgi:hypothetical protein
LSADAQASEAKVHADLVQALTCAVSPLDVVQELAAAGNTRVEEGFVGYEFGEEMDSVYGVALTDSLQLGGASTSNVVASLAYPYEGFGAYVHARFSGDFRVLVKQLKLTMDETKGDYQRAMPAQDADDVCPLTIELKPLDDGQFLLGCGWCNG